MVFPREGNFALVLRNIIHEIYLLYVVLAHIVLYSDNGLTNEHQARYYVARFTMLADRTVVQFNGSTKWNTVFVCLISQ